MPSISAPWILSEFWSRKLKPKIPTAFGFASSRWTIRLSFSPASMYAPSSRSVQQISLYFFLSFFFMLMIKAKDSQPLSMASSAKASRVPDVDGGPYTSIFWSGSDGFTSFQVLQGLGISFSSPSGAGTFLARARKMSFLVSCRGMEFFDCATTMPS